MIIAAFALFFALFAIDALSRGRTREEAFESNFFAAGLAITEIFGIDPSHGVIEFFQQASVARLKAFHGQSNAFGVGDIGFVAANFRFVSFFASLVEFLENFLSLLFDRIFDLRELFRC